MSTSKEKTGKEKKWFQSFDFTSGSIPKRPCRQEAGAEGHHTDNTSGKDNVNVPSYNWLEKYKPVHVGDLVVNNKKILEVDNWLIKMLSLPKCNKMLLLSGPPGCGKTTTVQLLAKKHNVNISEWITPVDIEIVKNIGSESYSYQEKQSDKFLDFILKASRFRSLLSDTQCKRIVLIEDYPNTFIRNPAEFHNILQKYQDRGKSPIAFICTDTNDGGQSLMWNLFPPNVLEKYQIDHISFNPIATTGMKQALKRIIAIVSKSNSPVQTLDQDCIDLIVNSSMGDVRSAVNNLCFASLKGTVPLQVESKQIKRTKGKDKKSKDKSQSKLSSIGKSESLSVMHGVGRVLNPKLAEKLTVNDVQKFTHSPESIAEHFEVQPISFVDFLHENYLPHFATIYDVEMAARVLSDADCFMNEWRDKAGIMYGLTVAIAGLMVANKTPVSSWHPVKGPKKTNVNYPNIRDIPLLDPNQMICGKVLATDYKSFCTLIGSHVSPSEDTSLIEEYTISE